MIEIPLLAGAANSHQQFSIQLGDNFLSFKLNFVYSSTAWTVDISRDNSIIIAGAMLEPGGVLTAGYHLNIGSLIFTGLDVTLDNLGIDNKLIWVPDE